MAAETGGKGGEGKEKTPAMSRYKLVGSPVREGGRGSRGSRVSNKRQKKPLQQGTGNKRGRSEGNEIS